jgi:molecular chaperone Hsp33
MLMPKIIDLLATGVCRDSQFVVAFADATETSRTLCRNHLCGPAASRALGEALAATALLGANLETGASVVLRVNVNGPVQGLCVEATMDAEGIALRGYPHRKIIDGLDEQDDPRPCDILGNAAGVQIAFTNATRRLHHASFEVRGELTLTAVLAHYFNESAQQPALVHVSASLYGGYLNFSRAFMAAPLPGAAPEQLDRLRGKFLDGSVHENLDACLSLHDLCAALELSPPENITTRPIRFHCGCSRERVLKMLERFSLADLQALINDNVPPDIICHMCGRTHTIPLAEVQRLIEPPF